MSDDLAVTPLHVAICVSDYERAVRFYRDALGYTMRTEREGAADHDPALGLNGVKFREGFMVLGNTMLALMAFETSTTLPARDYAFNRLGFTQMAFGVPDIDEAAPRVIAHGGQVLEHTRITVPQATLLGFTDPDGTRLELVQRHV